MADPLDALAAFDAEMSALDKVMEATEKKVAPLSATQNRVLVIQKKAVPASGAAMKPRGMAMKPRGIVRSVHTRVSASSAPVMYSDKTNKNGKRTAVAGNLRNPAPAKRPHTTTSGPSSSTTTTSYSSSSSSSAAKGFTPSGSIGPTAPPPKREMVTLRTAAGKVWEDTSLSEWPEGFRLFAGDLGPEVKDDTLAQAFRHYQSFQMARVIRDTRTTRVRGYGFVSFGEALDCVRAIRDEQGKYCGTRPLNLMRSKHQQRSIRVSKAEAKKLLKKKQRAQFE